MPEKMKHFTKDQLDTVNNILTALGSRLDAEKVQKYSLLNQQHKLAACKARIEVLEEVIQLIESSIEKHI